MLPLSVAVPFIINHNASQWCVVPKINMDTKKRPYSRSWRYMDSKSSFLGYPAVSSSWGPCTPPKPENIEVSEQISHEQSAPIFFPSCFFSVPHQLRSSPWCMPSNISNTLSFGSTKLNFSNPSPQSSLERKVLKKSLPKVSQTDERLLTWLMGEYPFKKNKQKPSTCAFK